MLSIPGDITQYLLKEDSGTEVRYGVIKKAVTDAINDKGMIVQILAIPTGMDLEHPPAAWVKQYFDETAGLIIQQMQCIAKIIEYTFPHRDDNLDRLTPARLVALLGRIEESLVMMANRVDRACNWVDQLRKGFRDDMNNAQDTESRTTTAILDQIDELAQAIQAMKPPTLLAAKPGKSAHLEKQPSPLTIGTTQHTA
mmetsp:Transcript_10627/g.23046  ORF Transcript_10627/g.23046 Transcript_10627/m.23046 type:complete len:198 (+) Transcript_10627:1021-1614(+)